MLRFVFLLVGLPLALSMSNPCADYGMGWRQLDTQVSKSCYFFGGKPRSFRAAEKKCNKKGGWLIRINSDAENQMIFNLITKNTWLGVKIRNHATMDLEWTAQMGVQMSYTNWDPNLFDSHNGKEFCGSILKESGMWNDIPCRKTIDYICEAPPATCKRSWTKALERDSNGAILSGSEAILRSNLEKGAQLRVYVKEWGGGNKGFSTDTQNYNILSNNVCAQSLLNLGRSSWDSFESDVYWNFAMICSSGNVHVSRWLIGEHTAVNQTKSLVSITWYTRELGCELGEDAAIYGHSSSGSAQSGSIQTLLEGLENGYDTSARFSFYTAKQQNMKWEGGRAVGQSIWHVAQRSVGNRKEFQSNSYWWLTMWSTSGFFDKSRWNVGESVSPGHNSGRLAMEWIVDPCWTLAYKHDAQGNAMKGSLDYLIEAVTKGHRVRILMGNYSIEADGLVIRNGHITAQLLCSISRAGFEAYQNNVYWYWQMATTTGKVRSYRYRLGSNEHIGDSSANMDLEWYIDTRHWNHVLSNTENGMVTHGSKEGLADAAEQGAMIRYALRFPGNPMVAVLQADNVAINDDNIAAQSVRSVSQGNSGTYEQTIQPNAYWWFTITSTTGNVKMSRWNVGEHIYKPGSNNVADIDWFIS